MLHRRNGLLSLLAGTCVAACGGAYAGDVRAKMPQVEEPSNTALPVEIISGRTKDGLPLPHGVKLDFDAPVIDSASLYTSGGFRLSSHDFSMPWGGKCHGKVTGAFDDWAANFQRWSVGCSHRATTFYAAGGMQDGLEWPDIVKVSQHLKLPGGWGNINAALWTKPETKDMGLDVTLSRLGDHYFLPHVSGRVKYDDDNVSGELNFQILQLSW